MRRRANSVAALEAVPYLHPRMRSLGQLHSPDLATRFGEYLYVQGIENQIDVEDDGNCEIWVLEDEQMAKAADLLERFRAAPDAPEFTAASTAASRKRATEERAEKSRRSTVADTARIGYERNFAASGWLPLMLIVASVAVAIYSYAGSELPALRYLLFSTDFVAAHPFPQIAAGQIWRLITPIFIHFGWIHLLFNMFWLRDLGSLIQGRFGAGYLGVLILVSAILSNTAQAVWDGPLFGGMSGVNYALFGFLWLRGKYDRHTAWTLNPSTVQVMLIWLVVCMTGVVGPVANAAHLVGFAVGAAWGYLTSGRVSFSR